MKKFLIAGAMTVTAMAQPALAVTTAKTPTPTIVYTPGSYALPNWTTATVFQTFQSANPAKNYVAGSNESVSGAVDVDKGTSFGSGAAASNVFLSITSEGSYTVKFTQQPVQYFSFSVNDLSIYNELTLNFANNTSTTLYGSQIVGASSWGNTKYLDTSGRVNFDMGGQSGISSVVFTSLSSCDPFLIDNIAAAAPEPGTWALMIVGFGMVGFGLRRAHRRSEDRFDARIKRISAGAIA